MSVPLAIQLDKATQSGLTLTYRFTAAGSAAGTASATESPAGSACYTGSFAASASTVYTVALENASSVAYWTGRLVTDANSNDRDSGKVPATIASGDDVDGATVKAYALRILDALQYWAKRRFKF